MGGRLKFVDPPFDVAFSLEGVTRKQKIDQNDIMRELFDIGMGGNFYAQVIHVPEECPEEELSTVYLYEPDEAAKIFAQMCGYTLLDRSGKVITGGKL